MTFWRVLIIAGITSALVGLLILTFQATMYLIFGEWFGFSTLAILQRLTVRTYLYTNVEGFDRAVDWLLDFPLPITLMVLGIGLAVIGFRGLQDEQKWFRPD